MPFCPECGKSVGATQKFCRSCGASLAEEPPVAASAPASAPAAAPAASPPVAGPVCRSCGASLAPDEKFCGVCGAKAGNAAVSAPAVAPSPVYQAPPPPPPVYQPPPPAPAYQPPAQQYAAPFAAPAGLVCKACGNPIKPGDKFCSKCLVKVPEMPVPAPAPYQPPAPAYQPPPPPQYTPPAPVAAPPAAPAGGLVCKACGNPIKPGDKFCSKCLVKVPDMPVPAPAPYQPPAPAYQAPPPAPAAAPAQGGYTCASCGSPVSGSEKFCGICGSPVVAAKPAAPPAPPAPPAGKFCGSCGAPITGTTKFCGSCGAAVGSAPSGGGDPSFRPGVPVTPGGEEVIGVIANTRKVKFLGASWDTWNIVITSRRMILVQMTSAMITAAVAEAQAKAKAEGKGFFGIMKDQMAAQFGYATRYEAMPPDMALAETPGNFAIENSRITAINLKLKDTGSGDFEYNEFKISIESADGRHEYMMAEDDRYINLLKQVYGDRVHMPFGYFRVGAARIKFF
ncbi:MULTISPECIES: zinc ribbon domain-containing protein [unclassified Methanoregula]|uniref:zinc ribbon domain-containing protein n=1 Tax=unclassified Methanoregula TaxID=2649730 RepID=UPI0009CC8B07|nr:MULTISPECIES: zinc ribbon domain-containing protein [unclassified Methanoregula]OPX64653.1 MAG: Double zinc ribbon [Methanoregula sp. PtaB.Bin085]OPY36021.1 MAG: Double zinc ribbon [Methanoregula sp. PtaU1.Bin006]